jgi:hypothetical protein
VTDPPVTLEDVRFGWGAAYEIKARLRDLIARRRDGKRTLTAQTPQALRDLIRADYQEDPVPRLVCASCGWGYPEEHDFYFRCPREQKPGITGLSGRLRSLRLLRSYSLRLLRGHGRSKVKNQTRSGVQQCRPQQSSSLMTWTRT